MTLSEKLQVFVDLKNINWDALDKESAATELSLIANSLH